MEMLEQLAGEIHETIQELRELAHGIYPPLLVEAGLVKRCVPWPIAILSPWTSLPMASVATPLRQRRPSTSAVSRRSRTRQSTRQARRSRSIYERSPVARRSPCPTTGRDSIRTPPNAVMATSTWPTASAP